MARKSFAASTNIAGGDLVLAIRDGDRCPLGLPLVVPKAGMLYICTGVYDEWYGLGCTIDGLSPKPYKGYFLNRFGTVYFKKVLPIEDETELYVDISAPKPLIRVPETATTR